MTVPGTLGQAAGPGYDDLQRQIRDLQQQINALVTARTIQSADTSAFVTRSYNGATDGLTFAGDGARVMAHEGQITAPITCSSVFVIVTATAGVTGGGAIYVCAGIRNDQEAAGDPGTLSIELADDVTSFSSLTAGFTRILPAMSAGSHVNVGVRAGSFSASTAGSGNGHVAALAVFVR